MQEVRVPLDLIQDNSLSFAGLGLLIYALSLGEDEPINMEKIRRERAYSLEKLSEIIAELHAKNHCEISIVSNKKIDNKKS